MTLFALLWLPVLYVAVSFTEWYVHKYHMHRRGFLNAFEPLLYTGHSQKHHGVFSPKSGPPTAAELDDVPHSLGSLLAVGLAYGVPLLLLGLLVGSTDVALGGPLALMTALCWGAAWNRLHVLIHDPAWVPGNRASAYLKAYHDRHHENPGVNFNAVALGWDWLAGTLYRERRPAPPE